jgi:hypothetical protein
MSQAAEIAIAPLAGPDAASRLSPTHEKSNRITDVVPLLTDDHGDDGAVGELPEREARILEFERTWWRYGAAKEQAVLEEFGLTATRYYQVLNALIDNPAALRADPMLVKRLRRQRSARHEARATRRLLDARR